MGARLPTGETDEPEIVEFGIAALAPMLEESGVDFPATAEEVARELGNPDVPVDPNGRTVPLARAAEKVGGRRYDSERELLNALHPVFESYREAVSNGLFASLRGLLPY